MGEFSRLMARKYGEQSFKKSEDVEKVDENIEEEIKDLEVRLKNHGRALSDIEISFFWAPEDAGQLKHYHELGVDRAILGCPAASDDETLKLLDQHAELMSAVNN